MTGADPTQRSWFRGERALAMALAIAGVGAFALWIALAAQRIGYPYELEWMEGAMVDEAVRVRDGLPVYGPPGVEHVPFLYTPLFYYLGALAMAVVGEGFTALRLVSTLATIASALLIQHGVTAATGRRAAGIAAGGLFCAGYGWLRTWYDLGRSDMVFLATMLAVPVLLRRAGRRAAVLAGIAVTAAFLTKQTALFWLPFVVVMAFARDRRTGWWFVASAGSGLLLAVAVPHLLTNGWSTFYVFDMPRSHARDGVHWLGFWRDDLVPVAPLCAATALAVVGQWRSGRRREAAANAAWVAGGIVASYASRLHVGGFDNVLAYGFAALCCAGPLVADLASARLRALGLLLLALQFVFLVVDVRALWQERSRLLYDPAAALPPPAHGTATEQLIAFVRSQPGEVWLPFHGHLGALAGKQRFAHAQALYDLAPYALAADDGDRAKSAMGASIERWLGQRRIAAIVLEQPHGRLFEQVFEFGLRGYARRDLTILTEPAAIRPLVGMKTDSPYVLAPRP